MAAQTDFQRFVNEKLASCSLFVSAKQIYCYRKRNVNVTVSLAIQRRAYIIEPI